MTNILIVSPLALRYIEAPLDQWYRVGALGSINVDRPFETAGNSRPGKKEKMQRRVIHAYV